jgi:hypothetical protein
VVGIEVVEVVGGAPAVFDEERLGGSLVREVVADFVGFAGVRTSAEEQNQAGHGTNEDRDQRDQLCRRPFRSMRSHGASLLPIRGVSARAQPAIFSSRPGCQHRVNTPYLTPPHLTALGGWRFRSTSQTMDRTAPNSNCVPRS